MHAPDRMRTLIAATAIGAGLTITALAGCSSSTVSNDSVALTNDTGASVADTSSRSGDRSSTPRTSSPTDPTTSGSTAPESSGPSSQKSTTDPSNATSETKAADDSAAEQAYLADLKHLGVSLGGDRQALKTGHRVCADLGAGKSFTQVGSGLDRVNTARGVMIASSAVTFLCPEYSGRITGG